MPQLLHDPVPALPLAHAAQLSFAVLTAQPAPDLHVDCPTASCHQFAGQLLHGAACATSSWNVPAAHAVGSEEPTEQNEPAGHVTQSSRLVITDSDVFW